MIIEPECNGCEYFKYESDIDAYVCISKSGCVR